MAEEITLLEKHIKKTTLTSNFLSMFIALTTALSVGYGFYYNTKMTLENNTTDIQEVQQEVKKIETNMQEVEVYKGVSEVELKDLKSNVNKIENNLSLMDEKLDKILLRVR
jgi:preprotein translocase subunit SecF